MIGGRYGSVDLDGVGFTEKEHDYAISQGKPVMAFLHGHPEKLAIDVSDVDPEARNLLEAFREKVKRAKHVKFWETAQDLALHVLQSFSYFVKAYPGGRLGTRRCRRLPKDAGTHGRAARKGRPA